MSLMTISIRNILEHSLFFKKHCHDGQSRKEASGKDCFGTLYGFCIRTPYWFVGFPTPKSSSLLALSIQEDAKVSLFPAFFARIPRHYQVILFWQKDIREKSVDTNLFLPLPSSILNEQGCDILNSSSYNHELTPEEERSPN